MTNNNSFVRLPMTDDEYKKLKADNVAEFRRLCRNEKIAKIAWPVYFILLGGVIGFLLGGGAR